MSENRFKPPTTELRDQPLGKGSAVKGVIVGLLVDVLGTLVFGIAVGIAYGALMFGSGRSQEEVLSSLANNETSSWVSGIGIVGGAAFSVLGGYVCERIARRGNYRLSMLLASLSAALGLLMGGFSHSLTAIVLLTLLTFGSIFLGTYLGIGKGKRDI